MDKLMQIRAFVRIAERASFSAVAREMDVTQSSVSKAMATLEKSLGTRLLSRSTRRVALTEAGRHYHERCRQIIADLDEADATVAEFTAFCPAVAKWTAEIGNRLEAPYLTPYALLSLDT